MTWLIAYDIACPRRWRRVYGLVRDVGVRLQYSLFLVTDPGFRKERFLSAARMLIDPAADDLRIYRLADRSAGAVLPATPVGIHWSGLHAPRSARFHPDAAAPEG